VQGFERDGLWLYGLHAARAALANNKRRIKRALVTERAATEIGSALLGRIGYTVVQVSEVARVLPPAAVHQGVALLCDRLPRIALEDVLASAQPPRIVLVLDQIEDPQNVGAILRTAAGFGAAAVIVQDRHAPAESGVLAKAASGALDIVPYVEVTNIARALDILGRNGFWRIALAADGESPLAETAATDDTVLVLGGEGRGLRRLVRQTCDIAAYIPITGKIESLNVSNAAAIGLYELRRNERAKPTSALDH